MNIVLAGWNENTLEVLKAIHKKSFYTNILILIAWIKRDNAKNLIDFCVKNNIKYSISKKNITSQLKVENLENFDLFISASWPYLIEMSYLSIFSHKVNIHASLLPKYRGQHPINWALLNDDKIGVTIHEITEKLDDGDIYLQQEIVYDDNDNLMDIREKIHQTGADLVFRFIEKIQNGEIEKKSQDENCATFAPRRNPGDGKIYWDSLESRKIFSLIRSSSHPGPGAFCFTKLGDKITIWDSQVVKVRGDRDTSSFSGEIVDILDHCPLVRTKDEKFLLIRKYDGPILKIGETLC